MECDTILNTTNEKPMRPGNEAIAIFVESHFICRGHSNICGKSFHLQSRENRHKIKKPRIVDANQMQPGFPCFIFVLFLFRMIHSSGSYSQHISPTKNKANSEVVTTKPLESYICLLEIRLENLTVSVIYPVLHRMSELQQLSQY